jgi:hypothetical protein
MRLFKKVPPTLSCRAQAVHPSLRSGRRPSSLRSGQRPQGGDPSADASGRQQEGLHKNIFNTAPEGIKALGKASG